MAEQVLRPFATSHVHSGNRDDGKEAKLFCLRTGKKKKQQQKTSEYQKHPPPEKGPMLDISTSSKVTAMINLRKTGIFPYGRIYLNVDRTPREKYNYRPPGRRCSTPFPVPFFSKCVPRVAVRWCPVSECGKYDGRSRTSTGMGMYGTATP